MTRAREVFGACVIVDKNADRCGAIEGGYSGGGAVDCINRHRKAGAESSGVLLDHLMEVQFFHPVGRKSYTYQATPVFGEEIDRLGGGVFGSHDEVTLVLPGFVVDNDNAPTGAQIVQGIFYLPELHSKRHPLSSLPTLRYRTGPAPTH